jgi:hypothetical protein
MKHLLMISLIILGTGCAIGIGYAINNFILFLVGIVPVIFFLFILPFFFSEKSRYYISASLFFIFLTIGTISLQKNIDLYLSVFSLTQTIAFIVSTWILFVADVVIEGPERSSFYFSLSILFKTTFTLSRDLSS